MTQDAILNELQDMYDELDFAEYKTHEAEALLRHVKHILGRQMDTLQNIITLIAKHEDAAKEKSK